MSSGSGQSSTSKPLNLDEYMKGTAYPQVQAQQQYITKNYPASTAFDTLMGQLGSQYGGLQSNLTGAQGDIASNESLASNLMTPEMFQKSMEPYLNQAYQGIGYSGMPGGSYVDKSLADAITQGWFGNLGNIENVFQGIGGQRTLADTITKDMNSLSSAEYGAQTEPYTWMENIQSGRYGIPIQKTSSGGGGFSLGF